MSDMTDAAYDVPSKEQMLHFATLVSENDPDLIESDFHDYSEPINKIMLEIREGMELSDEIKKELSDLWDDWKDEGFPIPDVDYDAIQEGGPLDAATNGRTSSIPRPDQIASGDATTADVQQGVAQATGEQSPSDDPDAEPDPEDL